MDTISGSDNELLPPALGKEATLQRGGSSRLMPVSPTNDDLSNFATMPVKDMGGGTEERVLTRIRAKGKLRATRGASKSERLREVR